MNRRIEELMQGVILIFIGMLIALQFPPESRSALYILMIAYGLLLLVRSVRGDYE